MFLKKLLAALGTLALVLGLVALVAGPASAHDHTVTADCTTGVSVNLTNYATKSGDATPNHVTVWIDNLSTPVTDQAFGGSFSKSYAFAQGQASHQYRVLVYAYDNNSAYGFDTGVVTKSGCETPITPTAATSTNPYCVSAGTVSGGGYTIPTNQVGVKYQLWNPATSAWADISAGSYNANPGAVIKIQAVATTGYALKPGATSSWTFTLSTPDSSKCVVPTVPTADTSQCTATPGSATTAGYTIPNASAGYRYYLQGSSTALTGGKVSVTTFPTTVVIVAKSNAGYTFPNGTVTTWTFTFSSPGDCHATVTPAAVTPQQATCDGPGTSSHNGYTVTATTGVIYQVKTGSTWTTITTYGFHDFGSGAGSVEVRAIADAHYVLTGTTDWPLTFTAAGDCLVSVPAGDPVFVDAACDADHPGTATTGTYTVLLADHVHYEASVNGSTPVPLVADHDNTAQPGDVVVITPIADAGYLISPAIAHEKLTHTFAAAAGDCLVKTDFKVPAPTSQSCTVPVGAVPPTPTLTKAFITIPADTPHAVYFINDIQAIPGQHTLEPGTYKVSAAPATGYFFDGYNGPWTEVLTSAEPCGDLITHPLVDPSAVQVQMGCFSDGSYALSNDLSDPAALTWTVDGATVSQGTYRVGTAGLVTVHVVANAPAYGLEAGATTDWSFDFERPSSCDLTTLALTGSSPTGWIALGYGLLVLGLALVALRFARRRGEQA